MDDTFTLISRIREQVRRLIAQELKRRGYQGIDASHGAVIFSLMQSGELSMNEMARKADRTPQTITCLVKKLAEQGYVATERSAKDSRVTMARLTAKGEGLAEVLGEISEQIYKIQYEGTPQGEIAVMRTALRRMYRNFAERGISSD